MSDESSRPEHPEADLLAGFAENSLTQHEREGVLHHLAVCAHCRQVIFLAHQIEPTADTQISELEERPFWRRKWSPLVALAGALALGVITFFWYGQFHKQDLPPVGEVAQQRAPLATSNEGASEAAVPAAVPQRSPAARPKDKSAAKRTRADSTPQPAAASPSPLAALNSSGASGDAAHTLTEDGPQVAAQRYQSELRLNSASKKQAADVMRSDASSKPGTQDHAMDLPRAVQSAKANPQNGNTWTRPPASSGAVGGQAYRQELPAPPVESNPAPESGEVHAEGCVEQGVEAGCLMVKDRQSGKLYHVLIKGARPQLRDGIEFTGVPHDGPTICMQGIPLDVITWAEKSSLKCSQGGATKK